jgi:hypothetical protein
MNNKKVMLYCQVGSSLDMAKFSIKSAIENAGLAYGVEFDIVFLCWKTSDEVYEWLKENNYNYVDMEYDEGKGFLWNLYKGWNLGYTEGYKEADYVCPIATDHAFYKDWLANLYKNAAPNRIVNCKLIEPGTLPTLHTARNLGLTIEDEFDYGEFEEFAGGIYKAGKDTLIMGEEAYTHRLDAMPFMVAKDVWERFGPMAQELIMDQRDWAGGHVTGDTDFFNRCKAGGVEVTKALDAISYHCGGVETKRNEQKGIYT